MATFGAILILLAGCASGSTATPPSPSPQTTVPASPTAAGGATPEPGFVIQNWSPAWSPDGTRIAFESNRDTDGEYLQLYVMNADGSNIARLSDGRVGKNPPSWSPDGTRIAFESLIDEYGISVMDADGSNVMPLTSRADFAPAWSPDGTRIAFVATRDNNDEIYVMDPDGSNAARLTENKAYDYAPAWSPDGTRIAFTSDRDGNFEVYVIEADGSNGVRLTDIDSLDYDPAWSPDGTRIAFTSDRDGYFRLYVMDADGSNVVPLAGTGGWDDMAAWSSDGTRIAFVARPRDGGASEIYVMDADGSNAVRLTDTPPPPPSATLVPTGTSPLGTFSIEEFESRFEAQFTGNDVATTTLVVYQADFTRPVAMGFTVDRNDATSQILNTGFTFTIDRDLTSREEAAQEEWFTLLGERQPEAVSWIRGELSDFLAAPGAKVTLDRRFGETCAGFVTLTTATDQSKPANSVSYWIGLRSFLGCSD